MRKPSIPEGQYMKSKSVFRTGYIKGGRGFGSLKLPGSRSGRDPGGGKILLGLGGN